MAMSIEATRLPFTEDFTFIMMVCTQEYELKSVACNCFTQKKFYYRCNFSKFSRLSQQSHPTGQK